MIEGTDQNPDQEQLIATYRAAKVVGIVGSEAAKFTAGGEAEARVIIRRLLVGAEVVVSGKCHLGGVDIFAVEEARALGWDERRIVEFAPEGHAWRYYAARNLLIAKASTEVHCITVRTLPPGFKEGGWEKFCYHCMTNAHIKSGGCWTVKQARRMHKPGKVWVAENA